VAFACSICEQESKRICVCCTKDACDNHICRRCGCCSDCCECDLPLDEAAEEPVSVAQIFPAPGVADEPESPSDPESPEAVETGEPELQVQSFSTPDADPPAEPFETSEF